MAVLKPSLLFLLLGLSSQAAAEPEAGSVESLYRGCKLSEKYLNGDELDQDQLILSVYCMGYLKGLYGMMIVSCFSLNKINLNFNTPKADTYAAPPSLIRAFVKWADNNPDSWNHSEVEAILPLAQEFPCNRKD